MGMTKAARAESKARRARLDAISDGLREEVAALNDALRSREVRMPVRDGHMMSGRRVASARYGYDGIWVSCADYGGTYAFGNDYQWAELLRLAGVERDPRAA